MADPRTEHDTHLPVGRLTALFAVLSAVPLIALAVSSVHVASEGVQDEVERRVRSTALLGAAAVTAEMAGLSELVESYARRPTLIAAMDRRAGDRRRLAVHLAELRRTRAGIATTFVADRSGKLLEIVPATASIVGKDFSFRDWYRGVRRTNRTYVSQAYRSQATGRPLVVAVATPIKGAGGRTMGILVAAYGLGAFAALVDRLDMSQDVVLALTDQRGVPLALGDTRQATLEPQHADPSVAAALRGESGVTRRTIGDEDLLVAYEPLTTLGWAAYAVVRADEALAGVRSLRSAVYGATGLLGLILIGGLLLLARTLRGWRRAEAAAKQSRVEAEKAKAAAELARVDAEKASRAKSEFLSRMSHELRTPLNSILGFGQLLEMGELEGDDRESVEQILKGGNHLLGLINEVLDVARIEAGRLSLSVEPVAAQEAVAHTTELIAPLAAERNVTVETIVPEDDVFVHADRQRLRQVLLNLLSNAVKYNREGGRVAVRLERHDGRVRLEVADTGRGLKQEQLERLFVPFERLDADRTDVEGTGLGLTLSRGLVEAMNGRLGVTSEVGLGSTFWVELEAAPSPVDDLDERARGAADAVEQATRPRGVVLYVEDNLANVKLVEKVLERFADVDLVSAMQGGLGLELAREHVPNLILLDLHLPDIAGDEVFARLRDDPRTAAIPVVVLSADATPTRLERLREQGADDYLTKPLDVQRFLDVLELHLGPRTERVAEPAAAGASA